MASQTTKLEEYKELLKQHASQEELQGTCINNFYTYKASSPHTKKPSVYEPAILGESIIDEIYYRVLCDERGGDLKTLLQQRGQIQQISKAVEYIHQNLEETISVEQLADMVNMSSSGFHKSYKNVMHISPLQYAKSIKLFKAQTFIRGGIPVSEAGYRVGYNSPAQFSREYKRHFGFAPSAT